MSILFDLDGTLIDTAPEFIVAVNHVRAELGLLPLPSTLLSETRSAISFGVKAVTASGFKDYSIYSINTLNQNQPGSNPEVPQAELWERVLKVYEANLGLYAKPFPGILTLLETLEHRNIPWGVVTNKKFALAEPLLERLQLKHRAACIVGGDTTPYSKPHPAPLYYACEQIGRLPNQCIYVGDAKTDIAAGNAAGMKTITALFGYVGDVELAKQWGADHTVTQASDILPWALEQWV